MVSKQLRIVVVDCPIDRWEDRSVFKLFHQAVGLKLQGYGKEYPYGVIAVDTTDFVGTHIAICEESGDALEPLLAYKSISLERCATFKQTFPPLNLSKSSGAFGHTRVIQDLIKRHAATPAALRYCSAYTIRPDLRHDRDLIRHIKDVFVGTHVNFHRSVGTETSMLCGVVRFKVDQMFAAWGYRPLALANGEELPTIRQASLEGEEVRMFDLPDARFSVEAEQCAKRFGQLWEDRLIIEKLDGKRDEKVALKKAA